MEKSEFFRLNGKDIIRGFGVAIVTAALPAIYEAIKSGTIATLDWKQTGIIALAAGITYLLKNLATNSDDKFLAMEPKPLNN